MNSLMTNVNLKFIPFNTFEKHLTWKVCALIGSFYRLSLILNICLKNTKNKNREQLSLLICINKNLDLSNFFSEHVIHDVFNNDDLLSVLRCFCSLLIFQIFFPIKTKYVNDPVKYYYQSY